MNKVAVFDIDGVLCDFEEPLVDFLVSEHKDEQLWEHRRDLYDLGQRYSGDVLKSALGWVVDPNVYYGLPTIPAGIKMVDRAIEDGFKVVFVTARPKSAETFTNRWLRREVARFDDTLGVVFTPDRIVAVERMGLEPTFFVDDNPAETERALDSGYDAFSWAQPWNRYVFPQLWTNQNGDILCAKNPNDNQSEFFWNMEIFDE